MTPHAGWRRRLVGGVAIATATLAPLVAYVGNLGFAPLIAGAGLVCAATLGRRRRPWPLLGVVLAAGLLAAASYGWGAVRPGAFPRYADVEKLTALKLLLQAALYGSFVLAAREVSPAAGRRALLVLGVGFAFVALLLLAEALGGAALYQWIKREAQQATRPDLAKRNVARATYAAAVVLGPVLLALMRRGWWPVAALAGAGAGAAALLFRVDAPVVALALGAVAFGVVRYGGPRAAQVLGAAVATLIAIAPVLATRAAALGAGAAETGVAKASWGARLQIWRFVAERIGERPWLGWGVDGSRAFPGAVPLHPHDFALQAWLELGLFGAMLAAAFWWVVWRGCARLAASDRALGAAAAASATAYLVIGALSFGAWQEWWLALGALAAAVVAWSQAARSASPQAASALYRPPS